MLVLMQTFCRKCAWCAEVLAEEWRLWSCLAAWETMHAAVPSGKLMTNAQWLHNKDLEHSSSALSGRKDFCGCIYHFGSI